MIQSIPNIKDFGVFEAFKWPAELPPFKQYNLIYGWNYSGKTTISRAFRCFELRRTHQDFANAQVQLKAADGNVHDLSAPETAPEFRVFNTDFVRENLSFDTSSATPVLVLGSVDISKREALTSKQAQRDAVAASKAESQRVRTEKRSAVDSGLTNCARDMIKNSLSVPDYDRTKFAPKVEECKTNPDRYLLDDTRLQQVLSVFRSTEKKPAIPVKVMALSSVESIRDKVKALLARVVTASAPISRLQDNPDVEQWVREGLPIHSGKDTCQFCGRPLPSGLLDHLAQHFSVDYENVMAEVEQLVKDIRAAKKEEVPKEHKGDFYAALSARFTIEKQSLEGLEVLRRSALDTLETSLTLKRTKAFTSLECPQIDDSTDRISAVVTRINETVSEHNKRTDEFDEQRNEAFVRLEEHYAATFARDQNYNDVMKEIKGLDDTIADQTKELVELEGDIRRLEEELSELSKGAEQINQLLTTYFGKDDLRIVVSPEKQFQIIRAGVVAKNLSEGERTAIAFAYFITRVLDGHHLLSDITIVIDDPVSSLDANHLFGTYGLIKTQLCGCRQLFVLTHSFEFYSLIRDWAADDDDFKKPQADWRKWAIFLVRRTEDGKAVLELIPKELLKFNSEYHYLFSKLYQFDRVGAGDFDCLLSLPNVVRRFMGGLWGNHDSEACGSQEKDGSSLRRSSGARTGLEVH